MFSKFDGFQDHKFTIVFFLSWTDCTVLYTLPHNSIGVPSSVHIVVTCGQGRAVVRLRDARSQHPAPQALWKVARSTVCCLHGTAFTPYTIHYTICALPHSIITLLTLNFRRKKYNVNKKLFCCTNTI